MPCLKAAQPRTMQPTSCQEDPGTTCQSGARLSVPTKAAHQHFNIAPRPDTLRLLQHPVPSCHIGSRVVTHEVTPRHIYHKQAACKPPEQDTSKGTAATSGPTAAGHDIHQHLINDTTFLSDVSVVLCVDCARHATAGCHSPQKATP